MFPLAYPFAGFPDSCALESRVPARLRQRRRRPVGGAGRGFGGVKEPAILINHKNHAAPLNRLNTEAELTFEAASAGR
ncbi:hypothetical protein D3C76_1603930 [compost metagenome]